MPDSQVSPVVKWSCFIVATILLAYTGYRAYSLSFTHDESLTYNYMVHNSIMDIISNNTSYISANNHILNTLFMKAFEGVLGNSEFSLRLQSLIAHCLYLLFTFKLLKGTGSKTAVLCGFLLLNVNPYLLDFFSLARGYAMAITFMIMSIWYFAAFIKAGKHGYLVASFIAACLSVLSNFALLNYLAVLFIMYEAYLFYEYKPLKTAFKIILRKNVVVFITLAIMLAICYEPIRILRQANQFYFGGEKGFWDDTVGTLIDTFLYHQSYNGIVSIVQVIVAIVPCLLIVTLFYNGARKKWDVASTHGLLFISTLLLIIAVCTAQHILLGTKFLEERYALFLVPLFIFVVIFFLSIIAGREKAIKLPALILLVALSGASVYHFSRTANLSFTYNWEYDAATKRMLNDLASEAAKSQEKKTTLGITWLYEPSINFYRVTKNLDWLTPVDRSGPDGDYDFYYVENLTSLNAQRNIIKEYPVTHSYLLKKIK